MWGVVAGWMLESVCVYARSLSQGRPAFWHVAAVAEVAWLAALLPLFHMHAYLSVGFVSVPLLALRPRKSWLAFWVPALLLASPRLLGAATHAAGGGFVHLQFVG